MEDKDQNTGLKDNLLQKENPERTDEVQIEEKTQRKKK